MLRIPGARQFFFKKVTLLLSLSFESSKAVSWVEINWVENEASDI